MSYATAGWGKKRSRHTIKLSSIDGTLIDAWNNKGLVLASLSRFMLALQCFEEVLKLSPAA